ncbi:MAG: SUMF1/EgtB/PvdO family nonheme iron enzyme [Hyphomicrobiaceae bacterium]
MTTFDIIFWLLIVLIAVLAYTIESGLSARHRPLVLSSILSATLAAVYMMFLFEDNSKFGTGKPLPAAPKQKKKVHTSGGTGEGGLPEIEVIEEAGPDSLDSETRYEDSSLLKKVGGFRDCPACPLMTFVSPGTVIVGSPADEPNRRANEGPQKVVRVGRAFAISRYEIQYREFAAFVRSARHSVQATCLVDGKPSNVDWQNPGFEQKSGDHPVVCVSWNDARAYAAWLSKKTDRLYRLPSESEWAYAARAGTVTAYVTGKDIEPTQANFGGSRGGTSKSGSFRDNAFKIFDMAGNVSEMADDCWSDDLSNVPASGVSERGIGDCTRSPVRGGGWNSSKPQVRSAYRMPLGRNQASNAIGIRLARELK